MAGPVQFSMTFGGSLPWEPADVKRGGGGGKGANPLHVTVGNENDNRLLPSPTYGRTDYVRRFFSNVAGLLGFVAPTRFVQTQNRSEDGGSPANPVPWDRRWFSGTYRPAPFRELWTVYVPQEAVNLQRGVVPRVVDKQRQMGRPNPNLLTVYRRYPPYSASTKILGAK